MLSLQIEGIFREVTAPAGRTDDAPTMFIEDKVIEDFRYQYEKI